MDKKPTFCILSTTNEKSSTIKDIYYRLQNEGYCFIEEKIIDDKITGMRPDFFIVDDIYKKD